jgi:hypothetical protein
MKSCSVTLTATTGSSDGDAIPPVFLFMQIMLQEVVFVDGIFLVFAGRYFSRT